LIFNHLIYEKNLWVTDIYYKSVLPFNKMELNDLLATFRDADYKILNRILIDPDFCEDRLVEFKAQFYSGNESARELRKDFASFANNAGGLLLFGVDDRKNICGVNLPEIRREITQKLAGARINWNILKTIEIPSGSFVYVTRIYEEAFYWKKPIIVDGSVWYRENGTCVPVNDISVFLKYDVFLPSDIRYFERLCNEDRDKLELLENGSNSLHFYYIRIFWAFEIFIRDSINRLVLEKDKQKAKDLLSKFQRFDRKFKDKQNRILSIQESASHPAEVVQNTLIDDLQEIINDYKDIYLDE
jgi:hypothetical protein